MTFRGPGARGKRLWRLVVDIYEPESTTAYPVLRHVFYGASRDEAMGTFAAHMKTDEFLRGCVKKERWDGVDCVSRIRWAPPGQLIDEN
jgi:hypothetical protein